ncbi:MAG: hypothetical protein LBC87_07215 [Fibromonadaceae bacterium]|nr:hypothetical protein [Fibromonadaceae bacterium]
MEAKFDKKGNAIGDGKHHIKPIVLQFPNHPEIKSEVGFSQSSESSYVYYTNKNNGKRISVRFSMHENNAVKFGDQLNGYLATEDEILFHLGFKKRTFIPAVELSIAHNQVSLKKLDKYEMLSETLADLFKLGAGADLSNYYGKVTADLKLITGKRVNSYKKESKNLVGEWVEVGKYIYEDL